MSKGGVKRIHEDYADGAIPGVASTPPPRGLKFHGRVDPMKRIFKATRSFAHTFGWCQLSKTKVVIGR
jgi:hypothetical protein